MGILEDRPENGDATLVSGARPASPWPPWTPSPSASPRRGPASPNPAAPPNRTPRTRPHAVPGLGGFVLYRRDGNVHGWGVERARLGRPFEDALKDAALKEAALTR